MDFKLKDKVRVIKTKQTGTVVEIQESLNGKPLYIIEYLNEICGSFFEEELETI